MEGTVAQSIVDPANPKTALSVRAMITANIEAMDLFPDEGRPFPICDWIESAGTADSQFLTPRGDQHASLRGIPMQPSPTWSAVRTASGVRRPLSPSTASVRAERIVGDDEGGTGHGSCTPPVQVGGEARREEGPAECMSPRGLPPRNPASPDSRLPSG